MQFEGKKFLVFGAGKSGIGATELLLKKGARPILFDQNTERDAEEIRSRISGGQNVEIIIGELPESVLDEIEIMVISPGVPCDLPLVLRIKEKNIALWSEIELAYQAGRGKVLAITGTNGKTTTTALLGEIMKSHFPEVYVVGNIGFPYTDAAAEQTDEAVTVAEISSFQLETIESFHPAASAITNITPDHLNRHHTMEEYIRVKELITENQDMDDLCVLNYEDEVLREFGVSLEQKTNVLFFSSRRVLDKGIYLDGDRICMSDGQNIRPLIKTGEMKLLGLHNYENVMTAAAMADFAGVPIEKIRDTIKNFSGVEHRIEYVTEKNGVQYYNDSKGTNPDAAIKGIQAMNRPTLLIGGGYDKQSTYDEWINSFDGKVKYLVLIGQTKQKIADCAVSCGFPEERIIFCEDLKEAVGVCAGKAVPGDAVLLSPACASWGQFDNYEQRGDMFKAFANEL